MSTCIWTWLMKRRDHKNVLHAQITNHFCRENEMRCQLQLTYQTTINAGSLRVKAINKLWHGLINYFLNATSKFWEVV